MDISSLVSNLFTTDGFATLLQLLIIVLEVLFILYAFILTRQVRLMNKSVKTQFGPLFTFGASILFFAALAITAVSVLTL